jgi:DNA-binding NtrC family response regulator
VSRRPARQVLLVEDEEYVRESLAALLLRRGYAVRTAASTEEVRADLAYEGCDLVLTDLRLPGASGFELLRHLRRVAPRLPVVVLTGHGTVQSAVDCMKAGAADYLTKPVDAEELVLTVERALRERRLRREVEYLRESDAGERPLGTSRGWREVLEMLEIAAPADTSVLLVGESGVGKEVAARWLHRRSHRAAGSFVVVNCAAVPAELFESELFGHRRGAFTGAVSDREGRFQVADGGTLFLDEVNSLSPAAQAKLLRVLQDGAFERVGESRPTRSTCASSAPATPISRPRSPPAASAPTSSTAST